MAGQLFEAVERHQGRDGDQAAISLGETRTLPHVAEQHIVGEIDELRGEAADHLLCRACVVGHARTLRPPVIRMIAATAAATTDAARIANFALFWLVGSVEGNSGAKMATGNAVPAARAGAR